MHACGCTWLRKFILFLRIIPISFRIPIDLFKSSRIIIKIQPCGCVWMARWSLLRIHRRIMRESLNDFLESMSGITQSAIKNSKNHYRSFKNLWRIQQGSLRISVTILQEHFRNSVRIRMQSFKSPLRIDPRSGNAQESHKNPYFQAPVHNPSRIPWESFENPWRITARILQESFEYA